MNQRIRQLAVEAGFVDKGNNVTAYTNFDHEKFAELIVRECAELTLDYKNDQHYKGWLDYRDKIKKDFGVE